VLATSNCNTDSANVFRSMSAVLRYRILLGMMIVAQRASQHITSNYGTEYSVQCFLLDRIKISPVQPILFTQKFANILILPPQSYQSKMWSPYPLLSNRNFASTFHFLDAVSMQYYYLLFNLTT
jgi:hypothetical protein